VRTCLRAIHRSRRRLWRHTPVGARRGHGALGLPSVPGVVRIDVGLAGGPSSAGGGTHRSGPGVLCSLPTTRCRRVAETSAAAESIVCPVVAALSCTGPGPPEDRDRRPGPVRSNTSCSIEDVVSGERLQSWPHRRVALGIRIAQTVCREARALVIVTSSSSVSAHAIDSGEAVRPSSHPEADGNVLVGPQHADNHISWGLPSRLSLSPLALRPRFASADV